MRDLWTIAPGGDPQPFLVTADNEAQPTFSADGRWIAYSSDRSGRTEVYIRPFPERDPPFQVSTEGGTGPLWGPNGEVLFSAFEPVQITERFSIDGIGFYGNVVVNEHAGTHMDAPVHFAAGALSTDQMDPRQFFAPLAVISIADRVARDPDTGVTVDDLQAWERQHGRLPEVAFVAMNSGWDRRVDDTAAFLNADAQGTMHFPGFTPEAAQFLTEDRDIVGVGVDTLSLDLGTSMDFAAHLTFMPANKYGLELMANLESVPSSGATLIVGAPKHRGGSGGQVRAFAVS